MGYNNLSVLVKSLLKEATPALQYRSEMYKRYTTESIPIQHEENPEYIQDDVNEHAKPDRRLYNAFESEIVDAKADYVLGIPVVVSTDGDSAQKKINKFNISINYEDLFKEVCTFTASTGTGGVLLYTDPSTGAPTAKMLNSYSFYISYNLNTPMYAIHVYTLDGTRFCELYTDSELFEFALNDDTGEWVPTMEEGMSHGFGRVPIVEVQNNKQGFCDFHKVRPLIDAYNRLVSDMSNEVETFRLAYLVLKNFGADERTLAKLRKTGAISVDADGDVKFLTKDIDTNAFEVMRETLERNIVRFADHVVFTDQKFTGNLTAIAVQFKIKPLERKSRTMELKLRSFFRELYRTYSTYKTEEYSDVDYTELRFAFTRNLPIDLLAEASLLEKLDGRVSLETALGMVSFVDNPKDEIERMEDNTDINNGEQ